MYVPCRLRLLPGVLAVLVGGCAYDEGLLIQNMEGVVRVPVAAATRTLVVDGEEVTLQDPRLIGPVYLGLYPNVEAADVLASYPHPEVGPQYLQEQFGDAYPYGGTTIGDLRFACYESLSCKIVSGRFVDWQDILDWYALVGWPVRDSWGREITNPELFRQTCFDLLDVTSDAEMRITAYEDRNADGSLDEGDLDFRLDESGEFYEARFILYQQEFFWNVDQEDCTPGVDCEGFKLWGWMDAPDPTTYAYATCVPNNGFDAEIYDADYAFGAADVDLLNFPSERISSGDWVSSTPFRWDDVDQSAVLDLDFEVQ